MAAAACDPRDKGPEPAEWYLAGNFTSAGDQPAAHLARRTATGWTGLDEGADGPAHAWALFDSDDTVGDPGLLYLAGAFNYVGNETGEAGHIACWGPLFRYGARRGDLNCDGRVDFDDVDPCVLALSAPEQYAVQYPGCDALAADCDDDGAVSFDDVEAFVRLLGG